MSLISAQTKWVLFLSSSSFPEDRHIFDLSFGLFCLESRGISPANIFIYIDGSDRAMIQKLISHGSNNIYTVYETKDFFVHQQSNSHENLVMFVTGHGSIDGIDALPPIKPYILLGCIKSSPDLHRAIIYLGQCHAGIFNYINAGKRTDPNGQIVEPEVIFMGATNLHESISASTQEVLANGTYPWLANIFLLHTFKWFSQPVDVDGDGKVTIIDSYKYAGALSNSAGRQVKIGSFIGSLDIHPKWISAQQAASANPNDHVAKLTLKAIEENYSNYLAIRYIHQECWILNSIPAQSIEL